MILNANVGMSLQKGIFFGFVDSDNEIIYKCSSISGKERVEVNGHSVSEAKNYSTRSIHTFEINGVEYRIQLFAKSLLTGPYECSLSKNGSVLKAYQVKHLGPTRKFWVQRLPSIILGVAVGMAYATNFITLATGVIIGLIGSMAIGVWNKGHWECDVVA